MTVGEFIMKQIFFTGISKKEAAEKIGVAPPTLNDIIKGKRKVYVADGGGDGIKCNVVID